MTYERLETERIEEDVDNQSTTIEGVIASNDGASNENNLVYEITDAQLQSLYLESNEENRKLIKIMVNSIQNLKTTARIQSKDFSKFKKEAKIRHFSAIIASTLKMCASSDCSCFEKNVEKLL